MPCEGGSLPAPGPPIRSPLRRRAPTMHHADDERPTLSADRPRAAWTVIRPIGQGGLAAATRAVGVEHVAVELAAIHGAGTIAAALRATAGAARRLVGARIAVIALDDPRRRGEPAPSLPEGS